MQSSALAPVRLEHGWQVEYFELEPSLYEWAAAAQPVPRLGGWRCTGRYDEGWAAMLQVRFNLLPADICVRYMLHIERAPGTITLYVNGRRMGEIDGSQPFVFDVTDYVVLEANVIMMRVACEAACADCSDQGSTFGRVWLQPVPCE